MTELEVVFEHYLERYKAALGLLNIYTINNEQIINNTMNLQNLKTPKTTEFNAFITPVMDYINENYKEYIPQLTESLVNEILREIENEKGSLVFIGENNKLYIPISIGSTYPTLGSKKINTYRGILSASEITNFSDDVQKGFDEKVCFYLYNCWDKLITKDKTSTCYNSINSIYYINDIHALIEFLNKERRELKAEEYKKTEEKLAEQEKYSDLAKRFGLSKIDRNEIDTLVEVETLQTKGLEGMTPIELRDLLKKLTNRMY